MSNVVEGTVYNFRLQARNIYGWGVYSEIKAVAAAGVPEQMATPTTENQGTNVVVTWQEPYDNSDAISAYRIYFKGTDKSFYETVDCDVSSSGSPPTLPLSCSVPLTTLRAAPFNLVQGALIQVRAQATNTNDWSDLSQENIVGAVI